MSRAGFGRRVPLGALAAGGLEPEAGGDSLLGVLVGGRKERGVGGVVNRVGDLFGTLRW